jgi:hypothetical protein
MYNKMETRQIIVSGFGDPQLYIMPNDFTDSELKLMIEDKMFIRIDQFNLVGDGNIRDIVIPVFAGMRAKWKKKRMRRLRRKRRKMRQRAR